MEQVLNIAAYVYHRYNSEQGVRIDEMKLHKMMYFAQRESLIQTGEPLFDATFYGWKYGPVLKELRCAYRDDSFVQQLSPEAEEKIRPVIDKVFEEYAEKSSWSLSRLTHGEISWINSRQGVAQNESSDVAMRLEDIREDAARVRARRQMLGQLGLL